MQNLEQAAALNQEALKAPLNPHLAVLNQEVLVNQNLLVVLVVVLAALAVKAANLLQEDLSREFLVHLNLQITQIPINLLHRQTIIQAAAKEVYYQYPYQYLGVPTDITVHPIMEVTAPP